MGRYGWWITAVAAPPLMLVLILFAQHGISSPLSDHADVALAAAMALVANALLASLAAPIVGVIIAKRAFEPREIENTRHPRLGTHVIAGAVLFALSSFVTTSLAWSGQAEAFAALARAHAVLAAASLALGAIGLFAGRVFRHPLDAAGASAALSVLAAGGVLAGGPSLSDAPPSVIAGLVLASPVVMTAASAGIDVFRTDVLYHVSPLAHVSFTYPAWHVAASAYAAVGALAGTGFLLRRAR